jgi:hypothetical protein
MQVEHRIASTFNGQCRNPECKRAIVEGDPVGYSRAVGFVCDRCCPRPPRSRPEPQLPGQLRLTDE